MYKHVLFDIDGTMIDSEPYYVSCLQQIGESVLNRPISQDEARQVFPMNSHDALTRMGVSKEQLPDAVQRYDDLCFLPDKISPFPGIIDLLTELRRRNIPLAIYSARFMYEFEVDPSVVPLTKYFDEIIGVGEYRSKPDPDGLIQYMKKHGLQPSAVLYIGDSVMDSIVAEKAGVDLVMGEWKSWKNDQKYPAKYYCTDPCEILAILDQ